MRAPVGGPCCLREEKAGKEGGWGGRRPGRREAGEEGDHEKKEPKAPAQTVSLTTTCKRMTLPHGPLRLQ